MEKKSNASVSENSNISNSPPAPCHPFVVVGTTSVKMDTNELQVSKACSRTQSTTSIHEEDIRQECFLLRDTNLECLPTHVYQLLQEYDAKSLTQSELLFLLIYMTALESGYATVTEYNKYASNLTKIMATSSFHVRNVVRLSTYQKPTYTSDANKKHFIIHLHSIVDVKIMQDVDTKVLNSLLTAFVTGDFLIVTLTPDLSAEMYANESNGFSVCLSIPRYVLDTHKDKSIQQRLRKMDELTFQLREYIYVPMRNKQLALLKVQSYPSLLGLPEELYDEIFQYLSTNQLNIIANVSKSLNYFAMHSKYKQNQIVTTWSSSAT